MVRVARIIIYFAISVSLYAQKATYVFDNVSSEYNLPDNAYLSYCEDNEGNLWIGGVNGLTKFDGFDFTQIRADVNNPLALQSNSITVINLSKDNLFWIGTLSMGIYVSDLSSSKFKSLSGAIGKDILSSSIYDIEFFEDLILITGNKGFQVLEKTDSSYQVLDLQKRFQINPLDINELEPHQILIDNHQNIWIGGSSGNGCILKGFSTFYHNKNNGHFVKDGIDDIVLDPNGIIWMSRKGNQPRFILYSDPAQGFRTFDQVPIQSPNTRIQFDIDKDQRMWIAVFGDQLVGYDLVDSTLFLRSGDNSNLTKERFFRKPFCDQFGNIWFSSASLYKYDYPLGFQHILHQLPFQQNISSIKVTPERMYIGYRENGFVERGKEGSVRNIFSTAEKNWRTLPTDLIQGFETMDNGNIAIVGFRNLMIYNRVQQRIHSTRLRGASRSVFQDSRGFLWVGGFDGLLKFDRSGNLITTYTLPSIGGDARNFIQRAIEDPSGNIWFASNTKGLAYLNPDSEEIIQYLPENKTGNLPSYIINDLLLADSSLWIATDVGLVEMNLETKLFTTFGINAGLNHDYICSVLDDDEGNIWASTLDGLVKFDPSNDQATNFGKEDGLINYNYYIGARDKSDGTLYFGGKDGVDFFNPEELRQDTIRPYFCLNTIRVDGTANKLESDQLILPYNHKLLEVGFTATRFRSQEKIEYFYRLSGIDDDWISVGTQRQLLFQHLAPGAYSLEIKYRIQNHPLKSQIIQLPIQVLKPWWQWRWLQILCAALFLSGIYLLIKWRERKIQARDQKEYELQKQIKDLEQKAMLAQMNPHFLFNAMNVIQLFIANGEKDSALRYLSKFSRLLRQVLNISGKDLIPLFEEIKMINTYLDLEKMRYDQKLQVDFIIEEDVPTQYLSIPPFLIEPQISRAVVESVSQSTSRPLYIRLFMDHEDLKIEVRYIPQTKDGEISDEFTEGATIFEKRLALLDTSNSKYHKKEEIIEDEEGMLWKQITLIITTQNQ